MSVKKTPLSLNNLCLQVVTNYLLHRWRTFFCPDNLQSRELIKDIGHNVPYTIYNQMFDIMVDTYARHIQNNISSDDIPSIAYLIDSIILPNLHKLDLNCLRHMGIVRDDEILYLEYVLLRELPNLTNLTEISLQTSGTDFTLPTCNDNILDKIGSWCPKLKNLDISYNHTVTDKGLECLIPYESHCGCPLLIKISLFECSVSAEGTSKLLVGLPHLKFLGYRESGQALSILERHCSTSSMKLELAHVNNLGIRSRTCKDIYKLRCDEKMVNMICNHCPKLNALKIRVDDSDVKHLYALKSISVIELVYNLGTPSSPGMNTIQYLHLSGAQLESLSFLCHTFTTQHLKIVCEQCTNLKRLLIRSDKFLCDHDISASDRRKCSLKSLEVFFLRVGWPETETCNVSHDVISYVLHKSNTLSELILIMKNYRICDSYIQKLFSSIQTSKLRHIMILVPFKNISHSSLNLSMTTVEALISMCPQLVKLGNLLEWDVSLEEIQELRRQLKLSNSALVVIYKLMCS